MTNPRSYVRPGQSLALAAAQVNWINEQMRTKPPAPPAAPPMQTPYTWVYARNTTGFTVPRWGIMSIDGLEVEPTDEPTDAATKQFQKMPLVTGGTPTATTTAWCVAVQPIKYGKIGKAAVSGVVQIKSADLGKAGGARLIYTNNDWALIGIGDSLRMGTISAPWAKGTTTTVTENRENALTSTFQAKNYFASVVFSGGTRRVACARIDSEWVLIAAEC